jgi:hypothetical protein
VKDYTGAEFSDWILQIPMRLWSEKPRKVIHPCMPLSEVIKKHITPGLCLIPLDDEVHVKDAPVKGLPVGKSLPEYRLSTLKTVKLPLHHKAAKRGSFEYHFTPNAGPKYFKNRLERAFAHIEIFRAIELHLHPYLTRQEREHRRKIGNYMVQPGMLSVFVSWFMRISIFIRMPSPKRYQNNRR